MGATAPEQTRELRVDEYMFRSALESILYAGPP